MTAAAFRRLAAYGAITRLTGSDDLVTLDGHDLLVDDGAGRTVRFVLDDHDTFESPSREQQDDRPDELPAPWSSDLAARRAVTAWVERYLEERAMDVAIRRDDLDELVAHPFSPTSVERLAHHFPGADAETTRDFLTSVEAIISA
ncbi:hypothetical protein GOARA_068_00670 [Gordonia araii NBRC 100433]|uniref:Uncharacterized protein n=1 Tax=Gordonia araii NBRC 100433 TaxID=1073574 RepID=G7H6D3_9ACTN|nr:hypothetical protein [Gordonia araii]NNG96088.1 hypothetical protein [Gordonia araii NBRC 100433]GAB11408.1 hypothetical protein GOARA_068_00670 [Gordonia araii NBRC 100433]